MSLWTAFALALGLNVLMFVPAFIFKTDKLTDISYSASFALLAGILYSLSSHQAIHQILAIMVLAWAVRLGTFLFIRINRMGKDSRFDGMRERFFAFLRFWILQGASVFAVLIAAILVWNQSASTVTTLTYLGMVVFVVGLGLEATADLQKYRFTGNPRNKGKWIASGVWSASRHPNYLGEMLVWIGVYLACFSSLDQSDQLIGLISPVYICSLLLFVSGIPLLEKSADARWGKQAAYRDYKKRTPVLIPRLFRK